MQRLRLVFIFCALASSCIAALAEEAVSLRGRILATRQMEGFEFITFVDNREYFLFRIEGNSGELIKVVRLYRGHTALSGDYLTALPLLQLKAARRAGCDETFASFMNTSNKHTKESLEESADSAPAEGVLSFGKPQLYLDEKKIGAPRDYPLKCYVTGQNDFEFYEEPQSGK